MKLVDPHPRFHRSFLAAADDAGLRDRVRPLRRGETYFFD